jgi:hypothetical protein
MNSNAYEKLIQVARNGETVPYSKVADLVGLDMSRAVHRNLMAEMLDEISRHEQH